MVLGAAVRTAAWGQRRSRRCVGATAFTTVVAAASTCLNAECSEETSIELIDAGLFKVPLISKEEKTLG